MRDVRGERWRRGRCGGKGKVEERGYMLNVSVISVSYMH